MNVEDLSDAKNWSKIKKMAVRDRKSSGGEEEDI